LFRFLQRPLAQFISTLRAPKSAEGYAAIGGGSPLRQMTAEQADALSLALKGKNLPAKVYVGMRYWHPFTEEAISQVHFSVASALSASLNIEMLVALTCSLKLPPCS
jgi:ferrochelatase